MAGRNCKGSLIPGSHSRLRLRSRDSIIQSSGQSFYPEHLGLFKDQLSTNIECRLIRGMFDNIVKRFLQAPGDKRRFKEFYPVCLRIMMGYLSYLRNHGYNLPVEKAEKDNPLADVAHDLLGGLLRNPPDKPYYLIFDFYKRQGIIDFAAADAKELFWQLTVLIRGYAKKELFRLASASSPQTELLKRRFKDIVRGPEYRTHGSNARQAIVIAQRFVGNQREGRPMITLDELKRLVEDEYIHSANRRAWCSNIFAALNRKTDVRNCLYLNDLLITVVAANSEHLELYGWFPSRLPGPDETLTGEIILKAKEQAITHVRNHSLSRFRRQNRLTDEEIECFARAARHFLDDTGNNGDADPIPEYFRTVMPNHLHDVYLEQYKYCFESVLKEALEEFRRILET